MQVIRDMRDKMAAARTLAERQALMAAHMQAMAEGTQMMKDMSGMGRMDASGGMPMLGAKNGPNAMPADMTKHRQMMDTRKDMMQTMMELTMQRMSAMPSEGN